MFKTKFVAILLSITTVFAMFAGVTFAENIDMETGEDFSYETLVIEDGKLISGNSALIDSGLIVLGDPDDSSFDANGDEAVDKNGSNRVEIKDNAASGTGGGASAPTQTPGAVSPSAPTQTPSAVAPSVPTQSASAIADIDYAITLDDSTTKITIDSSNMTTGGVGYYFMGQGFRHDYSAVTKAWMAAYNGYGYGDFTKPSGLYYSKVRITIGSSTGSTYPLVANNYNVVIDGGKTLEFTTSYANKGLIRSNNTVSIGALYNTTLNQNPMFNVANGTLRIVGPSASSLFTLDANGYVSNDLSTAYTKAPVIYVGANGNAELKNVLIKDSFLNSGNYGSYNNGAAILVNGGQLHLENVTFNNCETNSTQNGKGGAIFVQSGIVTIKNCIFGQTGSQKDLWATQGGAIYVNSGNVTMVGGSAVNCHAVNGSVGGRGGFAYINGGTFNVKNVTVGSTTAVAVGGSTGLQTSVEAQTGGAFYLARGGTLNIEGSTIQNCKSTHNSTMEVGGGGIYVCDYTQGLNNHDGVHNETPVTMLNISGSTIKGCVAETDGGGVFAHGGAINITNSYITNNRVEYTTSNVCIDAARTGGGIYGCYNAKIQLTDVSVTGNSAYRGGGVYLTSRATLTMSKGSNATAAEISTNKIGGGVYVFSNGVFNLQGGTMSGNEFITQNSNNASLHGGNSFGMAVLMQGDTSGTPTFNMSGGTISGHTNKTNNATATGNKNLNYGGAVGSMAGGVINMSGGTISGNSAGVGGGIYIIDNCTLTMTGGTISGNSATTTTNGANGGGGICAGAGSNVYIVGGVIENNSAAVVSNGGGGGIAVNSPNHFFIGGDNGNNRGKPIIRNNTSVCDGGGVYAAYSGIIIYNCEITGNSSTHGGGVYVTNTSGSYTVTLHNGKIDNNENSGVFLAGGNAATSFVMNDGSISGNTIVKTGGHDYGGAGICSLNGHSVTINGGTISGNKNLDEDVFTTEDGDTAMNGGGIAMVQKSTGVGTLTITGGSIDNNETTGNGGGIYVEDGGILSIKGTADKPVTISGNNAGGKCIVTNDEGGGGGIFLDTLKGSSTAGSPVVIKYAIIKDNSVSDNKGDGGGIWSENTNIDISNSTIQGNMAYTANSNGGGIWFNKAGYTLNVDNCKFIGNHAYGWGGGLCGANPVNVTITNSSFDGNMARSGGGIKLYSNGKATITNTYMGNNETAAFNSTADVGGAINIQSGVTLTIGNCYLGWLTEDGERVAAPNKTLWGGGIYVDGTSTLIINAGVDISNNRAARGGGAYFAAGATVTVAEGTAFTNNTSTGNGGGIYTASNLNLNNIIVKGNTAATNGGGVYAIGSINVNIAYSNFDGNSATSQGGGLATYDGANATVSYTCFGNNSAGKGGAIGVLRNNGTDAVSSVVLQDSRIGCLEYVQDDVTVASNTADTVGGGLFVDVGCRLSLEGIVSVCNNIAGTDGGGAYFTAGSVIEGLTNLTVSDNEAGGNGGGIYTATALTITDLIMNGNDAELSGGGLYSDNAAISVDNSSKKADLAISYNTARTGNGGGVYISYSAISASNTLLLKSCTLDHNTAGGHGGAVYSNNAVITINNGNVADGSVISNNQAGGSGGGVYVTNTTGSAPTVANFYKLSGTYYRYNKSNTNKTGNDGYGGAIYVNCGNGYITNNAFYGNEVFASSSGIDGDGGAVYVVGTAAANSKLEFSINTLGQPGEGNRADGNGGGLAIGGYTKAAILRGYFNYNHAKNGGAIYALDCIDGLLITPYMADVEAFLGRNDTNISDASDAYSCTTLQGNIGDYNGGGLYLQTDASIKNVKILQNTSGNDGGGLYIIGHSTATVDNTVVMGNTALGGNGGGVLLVENSTVTMNGSYIVNNSAQGTFDGATAMTNVDSVKGVGGGVAVFNGASFTLNISGGKGAIYGNTASVAANDVFANGVEGTANTKLSIPAAATMDINGETINGVSVPAYPKANAAWWEDYKANDTSYTSGLNGDDDLVLRYADMPVSIPAYVNSAEGVSNASRYVNDSGMFVSITFDVQKHNVGSITIIAPDNGDANQRFVFELTGATLKGEQVAMTLSIGAGQQVTVTELYAGTYTVTQKTSWSWRYSINGVLLNGAAVSHSQGAVEITVTGLAVTEEYTLEYNNTKTNILWLDHNSPIRTNTATQTLAARIDMAEGKKQFVI